MRYFVCNVIGGFRLSDLNRQMTKDDVLELEDHVINTSRAVQSAIKTGWLKETSKPEPIKFVDIKDEVKSKIPIPSQNLSIPDAKQVNKNLESRQSEEIAKKVSIPDFKKVSEPKKEYQFSKVAIPDFEQVQKNIRSRQRENLNNKDEIIKTTIVKPVEDDLVKDLVKEKKDEILTAPNFDEKNDEKKEMKSSKEERPVRRRRKRQVEMVKE